MGFFDNLIKDLIEILILNKEDVSAEYVYYLVFNK